MAAGLATLGEHPEGDGRIWHLPTAPASSTAEVREVIAELIGQPIQEQNLQHAEPAGPFDKTFMDGYEVYNLQTNVGLRPSWRPDVVSVQPLDPGDFGVGFRSKGNRRHHGRVIRHGCRTSRCTAWGGPASGIQEEHVWTYTPADGGLLVRTEESWSGPAVDADVAKAQAALDASLHAWRDDLKATAEARG